MVSCKSHTTSNTNRWLGLYNYQRIKLGLPLQRTQKKLSQLGLTNQGKTLCHNTKHGYLANSAPCVVQHTDTHRVESDIALITCALEEAFFILTLGIISTWISVAFIHILADFSPVYLISRPTDTYSSL